MKSTSQLLINSLKQITLILIYINKTKLKLLKNMSSGYFN